MILCTATEPKFIVEPSVVNFKKRIINDKDSIMLCPFVEYLTLKNPTDKLQKWKLGNGTTKQIISDSELKISKTSIHKKTEDR